MKIFLRLLVLFALPLSVFSAEPFPGIKAILTPQEYAAAGLNSLLPIQIEVIDGALARHYTQSVQREAVKIAATAPKPAAPSLMQRFGLPNLSSDWRNVPPLKARVTEWAGGNRFHLDNGQTWEGREPIPYELPGKDIEIVARPNDEFVIVVDGRSTAVQVRRLK